MAATMHEIEVFVMINESGDYVVCKERDELFELYANEIGDGDATRIIALTLKVPAPTDVMVTIDVPDQPEKTVVSVS